MSLIVLPQVEIAPVETSEMIILHVFRFVKAYFAIVADVCVLEIELMETNFKSVI